MGLHKLPFDIYATKSDEDESLKETVVNNEPVIVSSDTKIRNISEELVGALNRELKEFCENNSVLKNIIVSTEDGFEVASLLTTGNEVHVRKVSALASSLLGISSAMLKEVGTGEQNTVFMESDDNMILFNRITVAQHILCVMAITEKDEPIGQIFWRMKNLSESIIEVCKKVI
ncbi:roadblock/LC7 domain-containing protein [Kluyvera sichuanensis]|uniref:roadblock/LC7 domain-containing protein n=1 Tax=Kluyvera sichuanensis TaxID=2725494 RepID=UPI0034A2CB4A